MASWSMLDSLGFWLLQRPEDELLLLSLEVKFRCGGRTLCLEEFSEKYSRFLHLSSEPCFDSDVMPGKVCCLLAFRKVGDPRKAVLGCRGDI